MRLTYADRLTSSGSARCLFPRVLSWPLLITLALLAVARAQEPLALEVERLATSYHTNPARLDTIRGDLEQLITTDAHAEQLAALARVCFIWGDIRAVSEDQKLAAYDRGRVVARRAIDLEPENVQAHFWYALNTARWGQTQGIVRSLFLLASVQEEIRTILQLDAHFTPVYALAGHVYAEVPGLFGGDLQKSEAMFRKGLAQDPRFTAMRVGLGKTLMKLGRLAEARRELQGVLEEQTPSNPADWAMRDSREARELLTSLKGQS
jgi:tetratricopeptide (TPR) repeat protein